MKRAPEDGPPVDPVLAQLDALINGTAVPPPTKTVRTEEPPLVPSDPVLSQLDALINPGAHAAAPPMHFATPAALVLPPLQAQPPPLLAPADLEPELRGPPGILREYGGIKGWLALLKRADAQDA